jgi:hypothetical protein
MPVMREKYDLLAFQISAFSALLFLVNKSHSRNATFIHSGIKHLEEIADAKYDMPAVNQIEACN